MEEAKEKMKQVVKHLREDLGNLRTGRPNPAVLDPVLVDVYGTEMRIRDLGTITVSTFSDRPQLVITPFDPLTAASIAKGIEKANLGLLPTVDGNIIRVPVPEMTEELRKKIARDAKDKAEKAKVSVRSCRRDANDSIKKQKTMGELTEDDQKREEKQVQELTDQFCKEIDQLYSDKEKEILAV
ncbi:MAG: ribosome recycling factor [Chlamydiota bacterium]